jgi:ABC-2 type transport system ATP-binding protein
MLPDGTLAATRLWKRFHSDRRHSQMRHRVQQLTHRSQAGSAKWRWALRDVDFSAQPGESIGLFGPNGSGKSTLLKILSRVMVPDAGSLQISGRVGALIEVASGIHPQLSGRENVFLYGSLLGLSRRDVARRFDAIVDFAELEAAVDRQVKFYSSGMKMRLGFAVAAFLDPDVLLVDEVLAVGDTSFQQKCLDRIQAVLEQGTTIVFVSHDLAAVQAACSRGVWLQDGVVMQQGAIEETMNAYRRSIEEAAEILPGTSGLVNVRKVTVSGPSGSRPSSLADLEVGIVLESPVVRPGSLCLGLSEGPATPILTVRREMQLGEGETEIRCRISRLPLPRGRFYVWLAIQKWGDPLPWQPVAHFDVDGPELDSPPHAVVRLAPVYVQATWTVEEL